MDRRAVILVWDKTRGPITTRRMRSVAMERSRRRRRGVTKTSFRGLMVRVPMTRGRMTGSVS